MAITQIKQAFFARKKIFLVFMIFSILLLLINFGLGFYKTNEIKEVVNSLGTDYKIENELNILNQTKSINENIEIKERASTYSYFNLFYLMLKELTIFFLMYIILYILMLFFLSIDIVESPGVLFTLFILAFIFVWALKLLYGILYDVENYYPFGEGIVRFIYYLI